MTAFFRARGSDAGPGDTLWYHVWTREMRYLVRLDITASEPIYVPAGRFAALEEPDLRIHDVRAFVRSPR